MLGKGLESLIPPKPGDNQNNSVFNGPAASQPIFQPSIDEKKAVSPVFPTAVVPNAPSLNPVPIAEPVKLSKDYNILPETAALFHSQTEERSATIAEHPDLTSIVASREKNLPVLKSAADLTYEDRQSEAEKKTDKSEAVFHIEVDKIVPNPEQPRRHFDEEALRELAGSIREFGIIQPLVVSKVSKENENGTEVYYELIAGERRLMAAKMVGLRTVPVIVKHISVKQEKLELAIIENIQRSDLNPVEEARAYSRLQDEFRMTQREIASRLGKSRETVANAMRLLNLPSEIQIALETGQLNESQARLLLQIDDIAKQKDIFYSILTDKPSVRALKQRIKETSLPKIQPHTVDPTLDAIKNRLEEILGTKVDIKTEGDKGKITINFYSSEELSSLIEKLIKQNDNQSL